MKQLEIEYFKFEQDFMDDNIRCIPMIVRFNLDACGIKLKLKEWSKLTVEEREQLATLATETTDEINFYSNYLNGLIQKHTGENATQLPSDKLNSSWSFTDGIPLELQVKLTEVKMKLTVDQWRDLSILKRFALIKLTRPGHENRNFPIAMKEFGLA